ncbi:hypothetical protein F5X68DRAFT_201210 [Plectosphaerella plurivora]|uniref:Cysteine-rich transmembrane CYSTM domain-containing protein n=1 Tax=Plectosphaerella plurivora TaxID=936078 RepID=A0A9P9ABD8_9PEZI|nr:hypothetical protein F5X68DRAFT_201210 [Plectosphaerella plurivora]
MSSNQYYQQQGQQPYYPQPTHGNGYGNGGYNAPYQQQGPPQQMYYPQQGMPQQQPYREEKKDRGCLASCLAVLCCCWICGEACECCFDCLDCCC